MKELLKNARDLAEAFGQMCLSDDDWYSMSWGRLHRTERLLRLLVDEVEKLQARLKQAEAIVDHVVNGTWEDEIEFAARAYRSEYPKESK